MNSAGSTMSFKIQKKVLDSLCFPPSIKLSLVSPTISSLNSLYLFRTTANSGDPLKHLRLIKNYIPGSMGSREFLQNMYMCSTEIPPSTTKTKPKTSIDIKYDEASSKNAIVELFRYQNKFTKILYYKTDWEQEAHFGKLLNLTQLTRYFPLENVTELIMDNQTWISTIDQFETHMLGLINFLSRLQLPKLSCLKFAPSSEGRGRKNRSASDEAKIALLKTKFIAKFEEFLLRHHYIKRIDLILRFYNDYEDVISKVGLLGNLQSLRVVIFYYNIGVGYPHVDGGFNIRNAVLCLRNLANVIPKLSNLKEIYVKLSDEDFEGPLKADEYESPTLDYIQPLIQKLICNILQASSLTYFIMDIYPQFNLSTLYTMNLPKLKSEPNLNLRYLELCSISVDSIYKNLSGNVCHVFQSFKHLQCLKLTFSIQESVPSWQEVVIDWIGHIVGSKSILTQLDLIFIKREDWGIRSTNFDKAEMLTGSNVIDLFTRFKSLIQLRVAYGPQFLTETEVKEVSPSLNDLNLEEGLEDKQEEESSESQLMIQDHYYEPLEYFCRETKNGLSGRWINDYVWKNQNWIQSFPQKPFGADNYICFQIQRLPND